MPIPRRRTPVGQDDGVTTSYVQSRTVVAEADVTQRETIYRIRHDVYAV